MTPWLARAARRLGSGGIRGLSDALKDNAGASTSSRRAQPPWMVTAVRALGSGGSSGNDLPCSNSSSSSSSSAPAGLVPGLDAAASTSGRSAAEVAAAAAAAAAATRPRPPPGHTDFQQRQLLMLFTCNQCNTRAAKAFSKQSYEQGVVIVECPGCHNKHLIADNLGWFGQKGTVEQFAAERGGTVVCKTADGTVELTPEDLLGTSLVEQAAAAPQAQAAAGLAADPGTCGSEA